MILSAYQAQPAIHLVRAYDFSVLDLLFGRLDEMFIPFRIVEFIIAHPHPILLLRRGLFPHTRIR